MVALTLKSVERLVFRSGTAVLAEYHCRPDHPLFGNSGPSNAHCVVFPSTSTRIRRARGVLLETPAEAALYSDGEEYSSEKLSEEGSHLAWISLDPAVLAELSGPAARSAGPFAADQVPVPAALVLRQRRLFRFAREFPEAEPLAVEEEAVRIVDEVLGRARGSARAPAAPPARRLVDRARERLATAFPEPLNLAALAAEVGVSPAHLSREFRRATGATLHAFREELRLRRALDLLPEAAGDLTAVALDLGYSSHSHFTSRFHRAFGVTPTGFIRSVRRAAAATTARARARRAN